MLSVCLLVCFITAVVATPTFQFNSFIVTLQPNVTLKHPGVIEYINHKLPGVSIYPLPRVVHGFALRSNGSIPHQEVERRLQKLESLQPDLIADVSRDYRTQSLQMAPDPVCWASEYPYPPDASETYPLGIKRVNASNSDSDVIIGPSRVGVAVFDTGVYAGHCDLNVGEGANFVAGDCADGTDDCNGHGTHCAGTVAAVDEAFYNMTEYGVVGVAPGTKIYPVKVLGGDGSGYISWSVEGLEWVADNWDKVDPPIRVVSMSLGSDVYVGAFRSAIDNLVKTTGVVVVVAAGNADQSVYEYYPAAYYENVFTVAAMDAWRNRPVYWSNYSPARQVVDKATRHLLAAPGYGVLSTSINDDWVYKSGTSMAAPHVSGLVSRCFGYSYKCKSTGEIKQAKGFCADLAGKTGKEIKDALMSRIRNKYERLESEFPCDFKSEWAGTCALDEVYGYLSLSTLFDADDSIPTC